MNYLAVQLGALRLRSPLVLASGILGVTASSLARVAQAGAGAVTTKSFSLEPRKGHPGPVLVFTGHGWLNAVGLSNAGWEGTLAEIAAYKARSDVPLFASIFAPTVEEYAEVAARAAAANPALIEVNVSCPNVASEFGTPFEADERTLARITGDVKRAAGEIPVSIKLSPNFGVIGRMARVCEENGADVLTAINTVGPGMVIDVGARRPVLSNRTGGMSGPAVLPIAVRAVWELHRSVRLPIIGTGGVSTADDALQLILAGASAVGIGSGLSAGLEVLGKINEGLARFLQDEGLDSLEQVRGAAHG